MASTHPKYIGAQQVREVLTWPLLNAAVEEAMKAVSAKRVYAELPRPADTPRAEQPPRQITACDSRKSKLLFTMPGFVGNYKLPARGGGGEDNQHWSTHDTLACKVVTSFEGNAARRPPLPNIMANILLFSAETGQLQCVMDGTQITGWRTAAASLLATKYLYFAGEMREKPINVAIIGCGAQGESHALGMCATFAVREIQLWNRTAAKAVALAAQLRTVVAPSVQVCVAATPAAAVAEADVICVGTYAPHALIDAGMLKNGRVHINTVGAGKVHFGEVAQDIYDDAEVYVDSADSAQIELKDLKARIIGEMGEVILKSESGRPSTTAEVTIFQSMGMAAEDVTVAQAVYEAIQAKEDL